LQQSPEELVENRRRFIMKRSYWIFMRAAMTRNIDCRQYSSKAAALAALFTALALGGCQSPMYSGTPDDMSYSYSVAPSSDPSYVGRNEGADDAASADQSWTAEQKYEYRGGRDPSTGRANTQL
jgi:hypothetical protein